MGIFRLLLALSVIADHTTAIFGASLFPGGIAVQMFFMISGFYMALVLDGRYATNKQGLLLFYSNRALRLYPAFLAVTLGLWAEFLVTWAILQRPPMTGWIPSYEAMSWSTKLPLIFTNWFMIGTDIFSSMYFSPERGAVFMLPDFPPQTINAGMTWMHGFRTIGPAWSIGTEIWFYLLAPWLVRMRWPLLALLTAGSFACRYGIEHELGHYPYFFFPAQLLFFLAGIASYRLYRGWVSSSKAAAWHMSLVWINALMVLLYPWYAAWMPAALPYLWFGLSLPFMFKATQSIRWDRMVGDLSYPVYLVHLWVWGLLSRLVNDAQGWMVAAGSILLGLAIVHLVEKPFERLRRKRVAQASDSGARLPARHSSAA